MFTSVSKETSFAMVWVVYVQRGLPYSVVENASLDECSMFKVNGQRLKAYYEDEDCIKVYVDLK